jgi:hypothetical protein
MLLLLLACGSKAEPVAAASAGPPPLVDAAVLDAALGQFTAGEGWALTPLAQLDRGETHAVILWPMFDPDSQVVDDDVIGLTLKPDGTLGASNWQPTPRRLTVELGGDDWTERPRDVGVVQAELGQALVARAGAFQTARANLDVTAATAAAQDVSRLFALDLVLDQTVTELLVQDAAWTFETRQPGSRSATFGFTLGGELVSLRAEPVQGDDSLWWFTPSK